MKPMAAHCRGWRLLVLLAGLAVVPIAAQGEERQPITFPDTQYEPIDWSELVGWDSDDHAAAFATFLGSCRILNGKQRSGRELTAPIPVALKDICDRARAAIPLDDASAKQFF
jgi:membrane-bound lytic murein transglycosylase A